MLLVLAIAGGELLIAVGLLEAAELLGLLTESAWVGPLVASMLAGASYWRLAERRDKNLATSAFSHDAVFGYTVQPWGCFRPPAVCQYNRARRLL